VATDPLAQRAHVLFTMLTVLDYRYPSGEPALIRALRTWLGGWPGIGRIVAGMTRQGFDLQLARHGGRGLAGHVLSGGPDGALPDVGRGIGAGAGAVGGGAAGGVGGVEAAGG
jgi:hypothetical protein